MNTTQIQLLNLLKLAINGEEINHDLFKCVDGHELFNFAEQQKVLAYLYSSIRKMGKGRGVEQQVEDKWKKNTMLAAVQQLSIIAQIDSVIGLFKDENMPVIALKGLVLKQLYPQPELRGMCDLDLLVKQENLEKAIELMRTIGYQIPANFDLNDPGHMHIEMYKPGFIPVEIHKTLWNPRYMKKDNSQISFDHIWNNTRDVEIYGIKLAVLSLEDEYINMIVHLATHLIYSGCNLRQFSDLVLFYNNYCDKLDYHYIDSAIKSLGLFAFYENILLTCQKFLGLKVSLNTSDIDENLPELLVNDIFISMSRAENKTEGWLKLTGRYPFYRDNQFLSPIAFFMEVGRQIIKYRKNIFQSISYTRASFKEFNDRASLLRNIGLHVKINKEF